MVVTWDSSARKGSRMLFAMTWNCEYGERISRLEETIKIDVFKDEKLHMMHYQWTLYA